MNCRIIFNNGDAYIKVIATDPPDQFVNDIQTLDGSFDGNQWLVPATWDNVTRLMMTAGMHYQDAVYEGNGIETGIIPVRS